jgi:NADH dehydrogenase/NADH:ubiquinone oxidoreductase subunit G
MATPEDKSRRQPGNLELPRDKFGVPTWSLECGMTYDEFDAELRLRRRREREEIDRRLGLDKGPGGIGPAPKMPPGWSGGH